LDLRNLIFPGGFRVKEQDKKTDLEITEKVKGLGAKPERPFSYLCSLQNRAGGGSSGQIAVGSGESRLRQGAHGVEMIKGTKKRCLPAGEMGGRGRNPQSTPAAQAPVTKAAAASDLSKRGGGACAAARARAQASSRGRAHGLASLLWG
jgi:hypothetical protein